MFRKRKQDESFKPCSTEPGTEFLLLGKEPARPTVDQGQALPVREALGWVARLDPCGLEPRKGGRQGRGSSIPGDPQTLHFCLGPALLQSETSTAKLNKGKKSQTEQIPI